MKKFLPFLLGGLGLLLIATALVLRQGTADAHMVVTNLASTFMLVAGAICLVGGLVTFFLRDDPEIW